MVSYLFASQPSLYALCKLLSLYNKSITSTCIANACMPFEIHDVDPTGSPSCVRELYSYSHSIVTRSIKQWLCEQSNVDIEIDHDYNFLSHSHAHHITFCSTNTLSLSLLSLFFYSLFLFLSPSLAILCIRYNTLHDYFACLNFQMNRHCPTSRLGVNYTAIEAAYEFVLVAIGTLDWSIQQLEHDLLDWSGKCSPIESTFLYQKYQRSKGHCIHW